MRRFFQIGFAAAFLALASARAADIHVDNLAGDDANSGAALEQSVRTFKRAVSLLKPGDNLRIVNNGVPYHEMLAFTRPAGAADAPITVYGNGAVIDGSDPLDPGEWEEIAPGLYQNDTRVARDRWDYTHLWRFFLVVDGKINRMNRCMKGFNAPLKKPDELAEGEWTLSSVEANQAPYVIYVKIDPGKKLADCDIRMPVRMNGVSIHNKADYVHVKDLTATRVLNDGFNLSRDDDAEQTDIRLENIQAIDCGDDAVSGHKSTIRVNGLYSSGNGTGIGDASLNSVFENVVIENTAGTDIVFIQVYGGVARNTVRNAVIRGAGHRQLTLSAEKGSQEIVFENVCFIGKDEGDPAVRYYGKEEEEGSFTARGCAFLNLNWSCTAGGFDAADSLFTDRDDAGFYFRRAAGFASAGNVFGLARIRLADEHYPVIRAEGVERYRAATGDAGSVFVKKADVAGAAYEVDGRRRGFDLERFTNDALKERARALIP